MQLDIPDTAWEKRELLDAISVHDKEYEVRASHEQDGWWYEVSGIGVYSLGELIYVRDQEIIDSERTYKED